MVSVPRPPAPKQQRNNITNTICKGNNVVRCCSVVVPLLFMLSFNIVEWLFNVVELLFDVVGLLFNIVVYQILSWHPRIPQNCINMQNGGRADFNLIKVKIVIICKQIQWRCLHFSKLIPFVCKTLGFTSWNPWFRTLKPLVLQPETKAFKLWFPAYQKTLPFCIFMQ